MHEKEVEQIEVKSIRTQRKPNTIINNFFTLMTIAIMSIVIIWYVNFVLPEQKSALQKENNKQKQIELIKQKNQQRQKQIELSKRLNAST